MPLRLEVIKDYISRHALVGENLILLDTTSNSISLLVLQANDP
jgi:hypothetical protein